MPRSGTLWRYKLIRDLVIAGGGKDGMQIRNKYFLAPVIFPPNADLNTTRVYRLAPAIIPSILGETYVLNSHAGPSKLAKFLIRSGAIKVVYGYRDPRDCILSILEYSSRALPQYSNEFLLINTLEKAVKYFEQYINIWKDWTKVGDILVLKYEEMHSDYELCVENIVRYLNLEIPDTKIKELSQMYLPQQKPKDGVKIHFEHGRTNRFRENFNEEELSNINEKFHDVLQEMKYEL